MSIRILLSVALFALVVIASPVRAQSADIEVMITRMQTIMTQMELLQNEFKTLVTQIKSTPSATPTVAGNNSTVVFTESLEYGETNNDIKRIQTLLATDPEIYPYGVASGFFGPKTEGAIKNLQTRFNLDPVGVIGPATTALLEGYMRTYPDENYPDGVLSTRPNASASSDSSAGSSSDASNLLETLKAQLSALTGGSTGDTSGGSNPASSIEARFDDGETWIDIKYNDGSNMQRIVADTEDEDDVIDFIVSKTKLTESQVRELIEFEGRKASSRSSSSDNDEDDAEDALDDADDAIDDARDEINDADDDGDDTDWAADTLSEARDIYDEAEEAFDDEDYDDAVELAEDAEDMADKAVNRIDEERDYDEDDINEIIAYVGDEEAYIVVEYDDGDSDKFMVNEEDEDDIIDEVSDELDISEDDVEDLIEFRGRRVEEIIAEIDNGGDRTFVDVVFEDGDDDSYVLTVTDEDEIIEKMANKLDLSESDIDDVIEFD